MSPALNGNTVLQHFERGNAVEICNGIMLIRFLPRTATYILYNYVHENLTIQLTSVGFIHIHPNKVHLYECTVHFSVLAL